MRTTIDKAGRLVIPKELRDRLGIGPGEVEVEADGAALRIEPVTDDLLVREGKLLVIPAGAGRVTAEMVRALRDDQK